jgi:PhoPQ-activated pathogenicity-related protein
MLPDDSLWWIRAMPGEMHFRIMENCEHSLATCVPDVLESLLTFHLSVMRNYTRPVYKFDLQGDSITLRVAPEHVQPVEVNKWSCVSPTNTSRDIRWAICKQPCDPFNFKPTERLIMSQKETLQPTSPGVWTATQSAHPDGNWTTYFIEVKFPGRQALTYFEISSSVQVVPNTYPGPECHGADCYSKLV